MHNAAISWVSARPDFNHYHQQIAQFDALSPLSPIALQPTLTDSLTYLLHAHYPSVLLVTAPDDHHYFSLVAEQLAQDKPQQEDFPIIIGEQFDALALFGGIFPTQYKDTHQQDSVKHVNGLVHQANHGVLILSLNQLLAHPNLWAQLKTVLATGELAWKNRHPHHYIAPPAPSNIHLKVVLVGDRSSMAALEDLEPKLHSLSLFAEYEQVLVLHNNTTSNNTDAISDSAFTDYLAMLKGTSERFQLKPLAQSALLPILQAGTRLTESQQHLPLDLLWLNALLSEANYYAKHEQITEQDVVNAIQAQQRRTSYLPDRALEDIHSGQIVIETQGERIGQINGLTVVEIAGHPIAYGEPMRISCVAHPGDGDLSDVERKVELAGSLHAKGMMIMQTFVTSALSLTEPLPFAASLVFEQSYDDIDGDSASLAGLCAYISALAQHPITQQIAVTGSVDQFGNVQAIGGVNEKIEGFFQVCAHRGLNKNQGVILPYANLSSLCLNQDVTDAIKAGNFHLWAVEHVDEALLLLTGLPLGHLTHSSEETSHDADELNNEPESYAKTSDNNQEEDTLLAKIALRMESIHQNENKQRSLFIKLKSWIFDN